MTLRSSYTDMLADFQPSDVLSDITLRVSFHEQIEVAWLVIAGNRCIRAHDFFGGPVGLR